MSEDKNKFSINHHLTSKKETPKHISSNKKKSDQCKEYNTLKYKTMIMTGNNIDINIENETDSDKLNNFLEDDIQRNRKEIWSKLTKTEKMKKIMNYINNDLKPKFELTENEVLETKKFMSMLIDRKKLSKNNDISYDRNTGIINSIDLILFNNVKRKFVVNKDYTPKNNSKKSLSGKSSVKRTVKNKSNSSDENLD